jgi:hypothetical protein
MSLIQKKFGKRTYELWATLENLHSARKEVKDIKAGGFTRARYTIRPGTKESNSTFRYFIWVDITSNKRT